MVAKALLANRLTSSGYIQDAGLCKLLLGNLGKNDTVHTGTNYDRYMTPLGVSLVQSLRLPGPVPDSASA